MSEAVDWMRSKYVRLPLAGRRVLAPVLRTIPISYRFGSTYRAVRADIQRSQNDPVFVQRARSEAYRALVGRAQQTRYYRALLTSASKPTLHPSLEFSDVCQLPVLSKADVAADPEAFVSAVTRSSDVRYTSGSSGSPPVRICLARGYGVREIAFLHEIWARIGFELGDTRAILRDYAGNIPTAGRKLRYDPALRELWLSPYHLTEATMDTYLAALQTHHVKFLYGIPSALAILSRYAALTKWRKAQQLRGVMAASEHLLPNQRRIISETFGVPIISHYGMSERVALAGEVVDSPGVYEFEPLYGLVELLDEQNSPVTKPGCRGRIICTGLANDAMALLRYDVGDRATLVRNATHENCYRLRLSDINSKWNQNSLIGAEGQEISAVSVDEESYWSIVREYQFVQSEPGAVIFRAVPYDGVRPEEIDRALEPARLRNLGALTFRCEIVNEIPVGATGKRQLVIQRIGSASGPSHSTQFQQSQESFDN